MRTRPALLSPESPPEGTMTSTKAHLQVKSHPLNIITKRLPDLHLPYYHDKKVTVQSGWSLGSSSPYFPKCFASWALVLPSERWEGNSSSLWSPGWISSPRLSLTLPTIIPTASILGVLECSAGQSEGQMQPSWGQRPRSRQWFTACLRMHRNLGCFLFILKACKHMVLLSDQKSWLF